jgi:hypothetical protein
VTGKPFSSGFGVGWMGWGLMCKRLRCRRGGGGGWALGDWARAGWHARQALNLGSRARRSAEARFGALGTTQLVHIEGWL